MEQSERSGTGTMALLWALVKTLDEHGVLTNAMFRSLMVEMQAAAAKCRDTGDVAGSREISDSIGQLASYAAKRIAHPNVSADVHLKSFR